MNFLNSIKFPALAGIFLVVTLFSCEQDLTTIGAGVANVQPFAIGKADYDVFAYNKKIEAVQTNQLPLYQLGVFDDPIYGKTEARVTTQLTLPAPNPTFGIYTQDAELNDSDAIVENETIDSVVVYLPYQLNSTDSDNDGVPDALESGDDILDSTNDSDGDGVANNVENAAGTNPLNTDTDGDGTLDGEDDTNDAIAFAETVDLDSIYGNRAQEFTFKVENSTYFLRDLDPDASFQETQDYYSNRNEIPTFTDRVFYEGISTIVDKEYLIAGEEDDPETDENETTLVNLSPGIRVQLNQTGKDYFQENILDKEGSTELLSVSNFKNFIRGLHFSVIPSENELMFLLNISGGRVEVYYSYDRIVDDELVQDQSSFNLSMISSSNGVNTFLNDEYPEEINSALLSEENASKIYLKGGAGTYAEIRLFDNENGLDAINQIKANKWVINEASLVFNVDREKLDAAGVQYEPPRLYLYNAETNQPLYDDTLDPISATSSLASYPLYDGILDVDADGNENAEYRVSITSHVNNLVVRDSAKATLGLIITPDIRSTGALNVLLPDGLEKELPVISTISPLGTVLFGSQEVLGSENKKLKLEISYSEVD